MKLWLYIILFSYTFFFFGCQKELRFEAVGTPILIDTTATIDTTWQPTSKNSFWKYKSNNSNGDTTIVTAMGNTTIVSGKPYHTFKVEKNGITQLDAYFLKEQQEYSLQNIFTRFELTRHKIFVPIVYLINKNPKTGDEWWVDAGTASNNLNAKYKGTIIAPSLNVLANNKVYKNAMQVKVQIYYKLEPNSGYENFQTYYFYLAKGIGIIKAESQSTGGGTNSFNVIDELIDYKIN